MVRVQVIWKSAGGIHRIADAMLEDISPMGAGLRIGNPVSAGCSVEIQSPTKSFTGTVVYCRSAGGKYVLGIRKDPESTKKTGPPEKVSPLFRVPVRKLSGSKK
jgi:hypothetical protein